MILPASLSRRSRQARGYTLLAVLIIIAALMLLAFAGLQYAQSERRNSAIDRENGLALAIAEAGLERTLAYLDDINTHDVDLDRALDPFLDTACTGTFPFTTGSGVADDNMPVYRDMDGGVVTVPPSNRRYMLTPNQGGAYLVRIEDNDDDGLDGGFAESTSNNAATGCVEGVNVRSNPIRDRDRVVTVEVIGIYPGTDFTTARARRSIRVTVGPQPAKGIVAGGAVDLHNASAKVCGPYADIVAGQTVNSGCLCDSSCPGAHTCTTTDSCTAQAAGGSCSPNSMSPGSTCTPNVQVPPPPMVNPWDPTNAPPPCTAAPCVPFYYLRYSGNAQLYMWNYAAAGCSNPRKWQRLCHPTDPDPTLAACITCWIPFTTAPTDITLPALPGLGDLTPDASVDAGYDAGSPTVWHYAGAGSGSTGGACADWDTDAGYLYPTAPSGVTANGKPGVEFQVTPGVPGPRGIWFVEADVTTNANMAGCPGWNTSIITVGDFVVGTGDNVYLTPAAQKGYVVLSGRDIQIRPGNGTFTSCAPGAMMAHEQFDIGGGNTQLVAQVIAEDHSTCSSTVTGASVNTNGSTSLTVPWPPPVHSGRLTTPLSWTESSY